MQTLFLQVEMSPSMKVFSHPVNTLRRNLHLHYKIFCPPLTLTYPLLSNIHLIHHLLLLITMHLNLQHTNFLLPRQEVLHHYRTFFIQPSFSTIKLHINPTFLASKLRNGIPSQSFDLYQDIPDGTRYPMHHFLCNSRFSSTHSAYLANITTTKEPYTYAQTILDPNLQKTMDEELSPCN